MEQILTNDENPNGLTYYPGDLISFKSDYLSFGWKSDDLELNYVIEKPEMSKYTGFFSVDPKFIPGNGVFHFTVPIAFICIAQLAIISACLDLSLKSKPGEVFLRRIDIKCKRQITKQKNIPIGLILNKRIFLNNNVYYDGEISVNDDDFYGVGSFIMPLPDEFQVTKEK